MALPGHKSHIFKMGSSWGITAMPLSLPPKSGDFWKSRWKSQLLGSKVRVVNNPKQHDLIKEINKALKFLQQSNCKTSFDGDWLQ